MQRRRGPERTSPYCAIREARGAGREPGVTAATYRPCAQVAGFFAQGFAFTNGQTRGCVPLEVRVGGQARVQRVTLSLFAGSCAG